MNGRANRYRRTIMLLGRVGLHACAAWATRRAIRACPENRGELLILLAHFTAEAGDRDSAVQLLELSAVENPAEADALLGLAGIHREDQRRFAEAARFYERALSIRGDASEEFRSDLRSRLRRCQAESA